MNQDLIPLPEIEDIKEIINVAREDLVEVVKEVPDLAPEAELIKQVMAIVETKLGKRTNFDNLKNEERIDVAAYINFLQMLLDDFFYDELDDSFDDEDFDDEDFDDEEEESTDKKKK